MECTDRREEKTVMEVIDRREEKTVMEVIDRITLCYERSCSPCAY